MRVRHATAAALAIIVVACDRPATAPSDSQQSSALTPSASLTTQLPQPDQRTPFQQSLMNAIAERQAQGLPVPAQVTYEYEQVAAPGAGVQAQAAAPTVVARTVLQFDNSEQAGLQQWPALVVSGDVPAGARTGSYVHAGDYTQKVKDEIAKQYPDAFANVSFETGPRTYTFAETLSVATPAQAQQAMDVKLRDLGAVASSDRLLLGFTVLGPNLDYSISYGVDICVFWFFGCQAEIELVDFWAGFKLDWTIATRLPMATSVNSASILTEGSTVPLTSIARGEDWSADDFNRVGVTPLDGNEFQLKFIFKTGVFLEVAGSDVVNVGIDVDLDRASSFATPLGPGAILTLPTFTVSIWGFDYAVAAGDVGVSLTPRVGSDRYTADWTVTAAGSGSGTATYTQAGQAVTLGTLTAVDGPGNAAVQLSNFRYHFNQFGLDLGLYFYLSVLGYGSTWNIPITQFDLSGLTGGLYVGPHSGTADALALTIPIENVAPTVTLSRAGAGRIVPVHGLATSLAHPGDVLEFTGAASDPGRDDITLRWDWNDGPPAPDYSTTYPVPYQVSENRAHAFESACLYSVALTATDDDGAVGEGRVPVVVTGDRGSVLSRRSRLDGYWQHQFSRNGNTDFTEAELACYVGIVAHMSAVFGERRPLATLADAYDVLFPGRNAGDEGEKLDRQLLVAWLNFATGAVAYDELVDQNGDGVAETPFGQALGAIENARLEPATSADQLRRLASIVHGISTTMTTVD